MMWACLRPMKSKPLRKVRKNRFFYTISNFETLFVNIGQFRLVLICRFCADAAEAAGEAQEVVNAGSVSEQTGLLAGDSKSSSDAVGPESVKSDAEEVDLESQQLVASKQDVPELRRNDPAVGFLEAWRIPGVATFALCLFFSKLVAYTFLYWLPFYIRQTRKFHNMSFVVFTCSVSRRSCGGLTCLYCVDSRARFCKCSN